MSWQDGRRVVELGLLAARMLCSCSNRLHLSDTRRETRQGLGSILYVVCGCCGTEVAVPTGKRHSATEELVGPARIFDINTKMAAAMVNAGVGQSQINNILAELNLPPICHKTLKKREREIGQTIENVSEDSCGRAIVEELETLRYLNSLPSTSTDTVQAEAGFDGGWQKRGTGRCRNSLSGHVTVIGRQKEKVISFGVAKKHCRICSHFARFRTRPRVHQCRRNWNGSAKGIEPFLSVNCL